MRSLNDYFLTGEIEDVSTIGQIYIAVPDKSRLVKIITVLNGAITVANATLTAKNHAGTAMGNGAITVAFSGSAAGDVDTAEPSSNNEFEDGEHIEIETDGGSTTAQKVFVTCVMRR